MTRISCLLAPVAVALVAGCAPMGAKPGRIDVSSEPAGAAVYVMGEKAGVTPLTLDQDAIFPLTYPAEKQALYGKVELRKAGCQPATQAVSTRAVARGVHVKLGCGEAAPASGPAVPAPPAVPATAPATSVPVPATPAAQPRPAIDSRLRQVRDLLEQGLITEQEAREIRQRILDEL